MCKGAKDRFKKNTENRKYIITTLKNRKYITVLLTPSSGLCPPDSESKATPLLMLQSQVKDSRTQQFIKLHFQPIFPCR